MKNKYLVILIVALMAVGGYYWWSKSTTGTTGKTEYVTQVAEKGMITSSVSGSGNVTVDQLATVDPTISGTVSNLSVKVGDKVENGQHLFDIINDDLEVSVKKAESSLEQAQNTVDSKKVTENQVEADYEAAVKKNKTLPKTYTNKQLEVSKDKIDLAEADVIAAQKSLDATTADYNNQITNADKRTVTSPISGTVNEVNIKNGDDLGKSSSSTSTKQSPIIIGDLGTLKAQVTINEVDISKVTIGQKVMLTLDALDGLSASGKVEKVDALGTVAQGVVTYNVTIGFDTLDERIKPEMSVSASIITDVKQNVIVISSSALKTENGQNYVEVLKGETPEKVNVEIGVANNTETEITNGINAGDKVVTQTINSGTNSNANKSTTTGGGGGIRMPGLGGMGH